MKMYLNFAILAAGLLGLGASAGLAETITANIPFGFRVRNAELPAGQYSVRPIDEGNRVLLFQNFSARKSAMVLTNPSILSKAAETRPRMVFRCGDEGCVLAEVWGATATPGVEVPAPHGSLKDRDRLAIVYFERNETKTKTQATK